MIGWIYSEIVCTMIPDWCHEGGAKMFELKLTQFGLELELERFKICSEFLSTRSLQIRGVFGMKLVPSLARQENFHKYLAGVLVLTITPRKFCALSAREYQIPVACLEVARLVPPQSVFRVLKILLYL